MHEALQMLLTPIYEFLVSFELGTVTMTSLTSILSSEVTYTFRGKSRLMIGEAVTDEEITERIKQKVKEKNE